MTPALATRLHKLIPLLASEHDGEVVAAARAIITALKAEKLDLHDLAKRLVNNAPLTGAAPPRAETGSGAGLSLEQMINRLRPMRPSMKGALAEVYDRVALSLAVSLRPRSSDIAIIQTLYARRFSGEAGR